MDETASAGVRARQDPLRRRYREAPGAATITDCACTVFDASRDAFHGRVVPGGAGRAAAFDFGIHHAVGGDHDLANPGDLLCAALAGCLDSTLRMIAERMGIVVEALRVEASARVDVRGTLAVAPDVPVGFQSIRCRVHLRLAPGVPETAAGRLLEAAERACVVLRTLGSGVPVHTSLEDGEDAPG